MAKSMLSQAGYEVQLAHDAGKGLEIFRSVSVDAVFTDIVIPGSMNGLELARQIRRERPEIPILLTTGYYSGQKEASAEHKVLRKPYDESTLLAALQDLIDPRVELRR
jgi:CheY-like chemotaxis protein